MVTVESFLNSGAEKGIELLDFMKRDWLTFSQWYQKHSEMLEIYQKQQSQTQNCLSSLRIAKIAHSNSSVQLLISCNSMQILIIFLPSKTQL